MIVEDRQIWVQPNEFVVTRWIHIDKCVLGCRAQMCPEAVEKAYRQLLSMDNAAKWPCIVGHWIEDGYRFSVDDGRHEYLAALMLGRTHVFVCWLSSGNTQL